MNEEAGHRFEVEDIPDPGFRRALDAILVADPAAFDRYDNPFEQKWTWRDKRALPAPAETLMHYLEAQADALSHRFGTELIVDEARHYAGVFRYAPGDSLAVHVDAGIHPGNGLRKHVTALVYLGEWSMEYGGELELWQGTSAGGETPSVSGLVRRIPPVHGRIVYFENNDFAWHGVRQRRGNDDRVVLTVSFLSRDVERFENRRERAYFVPRPHEHWTPELFAMRDARARSESAAEIYRVAP